MTVGYIPTNLNTDGYADTREPDNDDAPDTASDDKVDLVLARARWKQAEDADHNQRKREKEDLGFYEGELQWPSEVKLARLGTNANASAGMPPIPARPCLTINKVKEPVRHVTNEFVQADLGISIAAADDFGGDVDENEIELREGLARGIQRKSNAVDARLWAGTRATICGRGYYGMIPRYVDGDTFDMEIAYRRFYNQFCVLLDPAHQEPDGSDAEWGFVGLDLTLDAYRAEAGAALSTRKLNQIISANDSEWRAYGDEAPGWFQNDGKTRSVRVSEYWRIIRTRRDLILLPDWRTVPAEMIPAAERAAIPSDRKRTRVMKSVKFAKIDGLHVFEQTDVPGTRIPIFKIVGEEIQPFDGERRDEGMVRSSVGAQRSFNYMISAAVETVGLAPKAPFLHVHGQDEGFEEIWNQANTRPIFSIPYRAKTDDTGGTILGPPQRQSAEPPIQAMAMMITHFDAAIKSTTGIPDPTLGNVDPAVRSGKAIRALLDTALKGTSNFMANFVRTAQSDGEVLNTWLYPIYGTRQGRIVSMMKGETTTKVMIGQPFVPHPTNGRPVPYDAQQHQGQQPKTYTLSENGSFNVAIKVSKAFETRREQERTELGELIGEQPEFMTWFGDKWFDAMDSPGHRELAERAKAMLAPPIQKLLAGEQPDDPRLAQMQQENELLKGELQKQMADKGAKIESATIKAQSDAQRSEQDNAVELEKARIQAAAQVAVAEIKAATATMQEQVEEIRAIIAAANEQRLEHSRQSHDAAMAHSERSHDAAAHDAVLNPPKESTDGN